MSDTDRLLNARWRGQVAPCCGGQEFDAPGGGYGFSAVLAEETTLSERNQPDDPSSALLALSIADPTWKLPAGAMRALNRYYAENGGSSRYTDNRGIITELNGRPASTCRHIAAYLSQRFGPGITSNMVQHSPGSIKRLLAEYLPTLLFHDGRPVVFPTPGYPVMIDPINILGGKAIKLPLELKSGRWRIPLSKLTESEMGAVIYVNQPHNPTGSGYTRQDWEALIGWAIENQAVLVVDEAYIDLVYSEDVVSVLTVPRWEQCCIVLQSVSKGWNATGLRFGWAVGHETVIKALRKVMDVKDSGLFGPSIAAGQECLKHPEWAAETRERYRALHQLLFDGLKQAGFDTTMPQAGLCQFTPAPRSANGQSFASVVECAQWFRNTLRISLMHYDVEGEPWLRWAVTLKPLPECDLPDEESVITEVVRRLREVDFTF